MIPGRPLRIVHITATPVGAPWLVELAREQKKLGHEVALIIPSLDGTIAAALEGSGVVCHAASVDVLGSSSSMLRIRWLCAYMARWVP